MDTVDRLPTRDRSGTQRFALLFRLALVSMLCGAALLSPTGAIAQAPPTPDYQRYITFHNDFDFPIYPVIQVPADLCDGAQVTSVRRILVNGAGHPGLQPQETLTVLIPDEKQEVTVNGATAVHRCWYQSGRIYIFPLQIDSFEAKMVALDNNNKDQTTQYDNPAHPRQNVTCFEGARDARAGAASGDCYTGVATNSFAADVPAQLAEYTFDSDNGDASGDPNTGRPMADIDVSYVDDVYLPVAASVDNHGATGYMGSALKIDTFEQRLNAFQALGWPVYAAYLDQNWQGNAFSSLLPAELGGQGNQPALHLPAGYNSVQNTLSRAASSLYKTGDSSNYLISGVLQTDSQVQPYVDRWMSWVNGNPCSDPEQLQWPDNITAAFDKQQFCTQFHQTVQEVWDHFLNDGTDGFQPNQAAFLSDCGLADVSQPEANQINACIIQHILGYNSRVLGGKLPGEVQALLRGVAYNAEDGAQQYQFDPFLTFATPFTSQFSLDPYTRLIHSTQDGLAAVAYSFSIDDKYGNFRDASSGFIVDAGGTTALANKQPYDPYQQYNMNWGYNLDKFNLISLDPNVGLPDAQQKLEALAQQTPNKSQPFLIRQGDRLAVLGHADRTNWKLTNPLVTEDQLQTLAHQEAIDSKGKTHNVQDLIDHTFGSSSIFPSGTLDLSNPSQQDIGTLDFEAGSSWAGGQASLYGFIAQQNADVPGVGNWVSASVCGLEFSMDAPGSQRLPLPFASGAYKPCPVKVTDSFGDALSFSIAPALQHPTDTYTGASVAVWGLPSGSTSGDPETTSNLTDGDLRACRQASSLADLCANVTLSATWAADPLARDVVYMGFAPKDMPRVNINLPPAPVAPPDPTVVSWPPNATLSTKPLDNGTVEVSWPAARVGKGMELQYLLYVKNGTNWNPVQGCDPTATSCDVTLGPTASLYVIAVNQTAHTQTPQLFGCYPAAAQCTESAPDEVP